MYTGVLLRIIYAHTTHCATFQHFVVNQRSILLTPILLFTLFSTHPSSLDHDLLHDQTRSTSRLFRCPLAFVWPHCYCLIPGYISAKFFNTQPSHMLMTGSEKFLPLTASCSGVHGQWRDHQITAMATVSPPAKLMITINCSFEVFFFTGSLLPPDRACSITCATHLPPPMRSLSYASPIPLAWSH